MLNEKHFTGHWWIISILLLLLLIDGSLASVLAQWIMQPSFMGIPQLTLLGLVMVTLLVPEEKYTTWIGALIGLVFDSFYTGILGVNALLFALVIYIVRQIRPYIPHTAVFVGMVYIIALLLYSIANYFVNHFIGYGNSGVVTLIANHLGPGLTVNLILFVIVYGPLHRVLINLAEE
ncbi:rod shape-determining protein MreD [Lacticaseibacillus chiayiensis]|uniref:Rod shape-determining protein MreD n=1 Tax=Lacticaseibacillus chiayiensis TaxID=2100821 RepID=A0A4Q1UDU4_9LACO|nr:rod shape-determining protein MreD [Lacticaseibacillus chiayiensis]QVI35732.1 rod shape-determining protein MreD [Lacticaseibacillus chiayiensis]RXT30224.1 rod shape-determining protein MreD [Lacticaseibacillus chiayiensis]UYN57566.1 rod shape-determining protein MreD [Lacticaseibacillus chiayiensis]